MNKCCDFCQIKVIGTKTAGSLFRRINIRQGFLRISVDCCVRLYRVKYAET